MSLQEAQRTVDAIVARMVAAGHPVEATNKRDHRPDHLPCDSYGGWKHEPNKWTGNTYFEDNLGSVLVGGWHSKAALVQLVIEMQREKDGPAVRWPDAAAVWHDIQAAKFCEMARDEPRIDGAGRTRAAEAARHHAGSAAALRVRASDMRRIAVTP